jgi:hypothetical protein
VRYGVLERIVESWLTKAGERGFEVPFAQLLVSEGFRVIQGPAHHPFEHGKDVVALDGNGSLWAFQLKGGDIDLAGFERIQGQLLALTGTAVSYPGVEPPRRPDRVALVTTGILTPPVRSRLDAFNQANRPLGHPILESIEREHLVSRFLATHGKYLPAQPEDLNALLRLLLGDGRGPFPIKPFVQFISDTIVAGHDEPRGTHIARSTASSVLLTAYATAPWQRVGNALGVSEGWLALATTILHAGSRFQIDDHILADSYELALTAARAELRSLLEEAAGRDDLIVPDLVEGVVYPTRALLICGYLAAFYLSERILGEHQAVESPTRAVLMRELPYIKVVSEFGAPYLVIIATALELLGEPAAGRALVFSYARELSIGNQRQSKGTLPDPYHNFEDALRRMFRADVDSPDEQFDGNAYTLHLAVDWLARRGERQIVASLWPNVTRLSLFEFRVSKPSQLCAFADEEGTLHMWQAAMPESWARLRVASQAMNESELPAELWRRLECLPYLLLLFPHRFVSSTSKALDYACSDLVTVDLDISDPSG